MANVEDNADTAEAPQRGKDTVEVKVIDENGEKTFTITREEICAVSPYFTAAFKGNFREADDNSIELHDTMSKTFEHFIEWLKYEAYWDGVEETSDDSEEEDDEEEYNEELDDLKHDMRAGPIWLYGVECEMHILAKRAINLYVFADAHDVPQLRRDATDRLLWILEREDHVDVIGTDQIENVYHLTREGSPLRRVLVDGFCIKRPDAQHSPEDLKAYPKDFLVDVMFRMGWVLDTVRKEDVSPPLLHECDYHEHASDMERRTCHGSRVPDYERMGWYRKWSHKGMWDDWRVPGWIDAMELAGMRPSDYQMRGVRSQWRFQ